MRRLVLVLMAVVAVFAVFAVPLVAVSHSPPGGEIALVSAFVGSAVSESNTVLAGQVIYRDAAITNFDSDSDNGNDYLMPAVVRDNWFSMNGHAATTTAGSVWGNDHRRPFTSTGDIMTLAAIQRQVCLPEIMRV